MGQPTTSVERMKIGQKKQWKQKKKKKFNEKKEIDIVHGTQN